MEWKGSKTISQTWKRRDRKLKIWTHRLMCVFNSLSSILGKLVTFISCFCLFLDNKSYSLGCPILQEELSYLFCFRYVTGYIKPSLLKLNNTFLQVIICFWTNNWYQSKDEGSESVCEVSNRTSESSIEQMITMSNPTKKSSNLSYQSLMVTMTIGLW